MNTEQNNNLEKTLEASFNTFMMYDAKSSKSFVSPSPNSEESKTLKNDVSNLTKITMQLLQDGGFLKS